MTQHSRFGRSFATAVIAAVLAAGGGALHTMDRVGAAPEGSVRQAARGIRLELLDQDIAFVADGDLRLVYRLAGDLDGVAELTPPTTTPPTTTPPTTTPPTTTPPTTTPPTTTPPTTAPSNPTTVAPAPTTTVPAPTTTVPAPPPVELNLRVVNYPPLTPADDLSLFVGSRARTSSLSDPIDGVIISNLRDQAVFADDGSVTLDLAVGTDSGESVEDRIDFDEPGLYPIVISLIVGSVEEGEVVASHGTIVQRLPGPSDAVFPSPPVDLAIASTIAEIGPEPSAAEQRDTRRELDAILATTERIGSTATLSIPPVVLAAAADDDRVALANALIDDELMSVPVTPLDVSAAASADRVDVFARQLREGEDLLTSSVPTTPVRRDVWIANEPLSAAGAQVVRDLGYRYVVMTPTLYRATVRAPIPETDLFVDIALPDGGTLPLLVVDELGSALTGDATDAILDEGPAIDWAVRTVVGLILDQEQDNRLLDRSRILATPDLSAPDPRLLTALEPLVATTPSVRFTAASALTGVTDVRRAGSEEITIELPDEIGPDLAARVSSLDAAALTMLSAGSMLDEDDPRPAEWAVRLAALLSTGYTDAEVAAEIDGLVAEAEALRSSVVPPEPFTFTLTGRAGDIDLRVGNSAAEPLTVLLRLSSPKLSFPEGEQLVELRPNDQTLVVVPVRARANGTSPVNVELLTPAGELIEEPVVLTSRVNALTGLGQVLTGAFVLILLTWWFSHWRKRRREVVSEQAGDVLARHPSNGK